MRAILAWSTAATFGSAAVLACSEPADVADVDLDPDASVADAASTTITPDASPDGDVADGGRTDAGVDAGDPDAGEAEPGVRWVGRFDTSDPLGPKVAWPGARVVVRFRGTEVRATLAEAATTIGASHYDVRVDGTTTKVLATTGGVVEYVIASDLEPGEHVVELARRTEASVGVTQFRGFSFPNGGELLAPPLAPARRIEFVGDSFSNGYGIECTDPDQGYSAPTQAETRTFAALASAALDADHHNISFSGKGLLRNYDDNDAVLFGALYPRTLPEVPGSTWTPAAFPADVVWITLGGNDWDNPGDRPPPDLAAFQTKYAELVSAVRTAQPSAHIVLAVSASLNDDYPPGYAALTNVSTAAENVRLSRASAGDTKVYRHVFTRTTYPTDVTGCEYHTNAAFHAKLVDEVVTRIRTLTGWP